MMTKHYKPDCGYGWVVVAACFLINFIMAGLARSAGVLYMALIDEYGASREAATAPFSLRFCIRNLSGPLVGVLGQQFGIRPVVLLGGLICGLGGILSALASDVTWITMSWGCVHGLGYGMNNIIHVIVINRYFNKYKGLALGICLTGDCFGTLLLPLLMEIVLPIYCLSGTFLILAGISLNVIPAAMLLVYPAWETKSSEIDTEYVYSAFKKECIDNEGFVISPEDSITKVDINNIKRIIPAIVINEQQNNQNLMTNENEKLDNSSKNSIDHTRLHINGDVKDAFWKDSVIFSRTCRLNSTSSVQLQDRSDKAKSLSFNVNIISDSSKTRCASILSVISCPSQVEKHTVDTECKIIVNQPIQNLISNTWYLGDDTGDAQKLFNYPKNSHDNILEGRNFSNSISNDNESHRNVSKYDILYYEKYLKQFHDEEYNENISLNDTEVIQKNGLKKFLKTNIKPIFLIISATMAFYVFLFISIFTIIIDYTADNNIPNEYGKYLIIAFSVTDIFGRIGFGIVLDKKWISLSMYAGLVTGLMGFFMLVIPLYKCFILWMINFSLFGFIQGGASIMFPALVEYYMDKNEESVALGSLNFYGGLLMLPIPPMIGYFRDNIGSYDGVFYTVGALCILVGSLWSLESFLVQKKHKVSRKALCPAEVKF